MKHKVCINVRNDCETETVLQSGQKTIKRWLFSLLFGQEVGIIVLTPGRTVETVEIKELAKGGTP